MRYEVKVHRLGDLCTFVRGTSPTLKTTPGPFPLVVTAEFRRSADTWQIEGPAVCVPLISSTGHGDAALHRVHYQEGKFALANLLVALIPRDQEVCSARYLYHLLQTRKDELLVPLMLGTANVSLKERDICRVEIPLPSIAEQRRVVARIEELAVQVQRAQDFRQQAGAETGSLVLRSRDAKFAGLRATFPNHPLGELISMASGEGLTSSEMNDVAPYPVYGGGGLNGRHSRYMFEEPKIVIGRVGARCGCVFVTEPKAWVTDNALYVKHLSPSLDTAYLTHALTTLDLRQQANQAAQPVVSQKKINPLLIPVPPLAEQHQIVAELEALYTQVDSLKRVQAETAIELDALLPAILDRAFKGELV